MHTYILRRNFPSKINSNDFGPLRITHDQRLFFFGDCFFRRFRIGFSGRGFHLVPVVRVTSHLTVRNGGPRGYEHELEYAVATKEEMDDALFR